MNESTGNGGHILIKNSIQSKNNLYQLVVFSIDELRYALPLPAIERIVRVVEITPLPKAPDIVLGVVDVQGQIIPVINIRSRFGLPEREMNLNDQLVIARASEQSVALLVNAVSGVVECPEEEVVTVEEIIPGTEYVTGIIKRDEGMILVLDLDTILSFEEVKSLGKAMKKTQRGKK